MCTMACLVNTMVRHEFHYYNIYQHCITISHQSISDLYLILFGGELVTVTHLSKIGKSSI